jgi:putative transcription factor
VICEMCGREVAATTPVRVEGTVLRLCATCGRFGTAVEPTPAPMSSAPTRGDGARGSPSFGPPVVRGFAGRRASERDLFAEPPELELASDWSRRIRAARERLGWTPEDLAKRLNEKKSVVLKMESGSFHPPDPTVRKLEHLLKIRLRASPSDDAEASA